MLFPESRLHVPEMDGLKSSVDKHFIPRLRKSFHDASYKNIDRTTTARIYRGIAH